MQEDLKRAGIRPFAWVVNPCLAPLHLTHALLRARQGNELRFIDEVRQLSERFAVVPWLAREPTGVVGLQQLTQAADDTVTNPLYEKARHHANL